jgi:large subunit ribosomal protein L16
MFFTPIIKKKIQRGNFAKKLYRKDQLLHGEFGLRVNKSFLLTVKQIESCNKIFKRLLPRNTRVRLNCYPDISVSKKSIGVRIGNGKGSVNNWVAKVGAGRILFEISGATEKDAKVALKEVSWRLPVLVKVVHLERILPSI